jgi:hypothetical protein
MRVIVTTVTRSPKGNPMRASREITADQIRIGRGAECELRLADPRVPLHARSIFLGRQGPQLFEASEQFSDATLASITGVQRPQALRPGTSLRIGPFQIDVVEPHHGADLALIVELVQPLPGKSAVTAEELCAQTSRGPVSRRALSWTLFLLVLGFFLALPTLGGFFERDTPAPVAARDSALLRQAVQRVGATAQQSWNPGALASGHQPFANDCRACHSDSFTRVQDRDCQACHRNLGDHVSREAKVAGLTEVRCASCHRDHQGATALQQQNTHFFMGECSACHRDIKAHLPTTPTGDTADFATLHPQFRATLVTGLEPATGRALQARVRLGGNSRPVEQRGLKFPHDVHLDPQGVKGPQGLVQTDCGSCHVPDGSSRGFRPVTMKAHCQSCHELRFELAAPERQVPHGNVDAVMATMREFYSYLAVNGTVLNQAQTPSPATRSIPGKTAPAPRVLTGRVDVDAQVLAAATEIFEKTTCFTCHDITRLARDDGTPDWKVSPVLPAPAWMPAARFRHDRHDMASCATCHAAPQSKSAQDVLMPGIETCRGCHAGNHPEKQKVTSNCGLCHGFHQHPSTPVTSRPAPPWPSARDAALLQAPTLKPAAVQ